jgi:hypothetical protein
MRASRLYQCTRWSLLLLRVCHDKLALKPPRTQATPVLEALFFPSLQTRMKLADTFFICPSWCSLDEPHEQISDFYSTDEKDVPCAGN